MFSSRARLFGMSADRLFLRTVPVPVVWMDGMCVCISQSTPHDSMVVTVLRSSTNSSRVEQVLQRDATSKLICDSFQLKVHTNVRI